MRIKDISWCGQTLYCYSLRIDISSANVNSDEVHTEIYEPKVHGPGWAYFDKAANYIRLNFDYYVIGREYSESGKLHLQCFVAKKSRLGEKDLLSMRHYIKKHIADKSTKQPVSLKKSWSPLGLFTYCRKDGDIKVCMPDELWHYLDTLAEAAMLPPRAKVLQTALQKARSLKGFVRLLCEQVELGALHSVPRKSEVWRLALGKKLISHNMFFEEFYSPR